MTSNNHDNFLRTVFSTPDHAASLLGTTMGERFLRNFDLSTLSLVSGTFVDEDLRRHEVDLLFKIQATEKLVYIYVLVEHQSTPFAMMPVRLFRYVSKIYQALDAENRSQRHVPEIIPVVLYNGERRWTAPVKLSDFYSRPTLTGLAGVAPIELEYKLFDLSATSDAQIRERKRVTTSVAVLSLLFLKHFRNEYFGQLLKEWASFFKDAYRETKGESFVQAAICYILESTNAAHEDLIDCIVPYTEPEVEFVIKTTGQKLREEGRIEGRQEGRQEGLTMGRQAAAKALRLILLSRFRDLTDDQNRKIDVASFEQLDTFLDRAFVVGTVDEVLR